MVQPVPNIPELWTITSRFGEGTYTVAASDPICPNCGSTLCVAVELGQRRGEGVLKAGPMLDYVRSLR